MYSTKFRRPFKIIYCEIYLDRNDAFVREKFLKTGWGRNYLKKGLKNYFEAKKLGRQRLTHQNFAPLQISEKFDEGEKQNLGG